MQDNSATAMGMNGAFYSTYTHALDKKGRVSVPSAFRRVLKASKQTGIYCCPSVNGQALDAGGSAFQSTLRDALLVPNLSWADRDYLETVIFGQSDFLKIDSDQQSAARSQHGRHQAEQLTCIFRSEIADG